MNAEFYNIAECKSAREDFEAQLSCDELIEKLENSIGTDNIIGARISGKSSGGIWLSFGYNTRGFLEERRCDVNRKHKFVENAEIGDYINVCILHKADNSVYMAARDSIVNRASEFHKNTISPGSIVQATVCSVSDFFTDVDLGAGDTAALHASQIRCSYLETMKEHFYRGQEINLLVEGWDDKINGYKLKYQDVRQGNGIKTHTVIQARIIKMSDDKNCECIFPDYPMTSGIVTAIPKGYKLKAGDHIPVSVIDIQKNTIITKF